MSLVIITKVLSEEDATFETIINIMNLNQKVNCKRVIETIDEVDTRLRESRSLYIFSLQDSAIAKEILIQCIEVESFKVENITIETRINNI